jgi:hypothetical protein
MEGKNEKTETSREIRKILLGFPTVLIAVTQ